HRQSTAPNVGSAARGCPFTEDIPATTSRRAPNSYGPQRGRSRGLERGNQRHTELHHDPPGRPASQARGAEDDLATDLGSAGLPVYLAGFAAEHVLTGRRAAQRMTETGSRS